MNCPFASMSAWYGVSFFCLTSSDATKVPSPLAFSGGSIRVPDAPGLGVELDRDALAALHEQYLRCGIRERDDTGYMRTVDPSYHHVRPRW